MMNYLNTIIAIVPRLPPAVDGVGDYALNLARQIRKDFNINTHFIVGDPQWQGEREITGFPVTQITLRTSERLVKELTSSSCTILLHYVGYGYEKRGCPVWLVDGLQQYKKLYPQHRLVTMFHEIYASGPPWTSSFWLSPLQKNLAARLAKLSDRCVTSTQGYAKTLCTLLGEQNFPVLSLPVFSNIGEPHPIVPLLERQKRLVIFGHKNSRRQVYEQCLTDLKTTCQKLNIEEIYDIGATTGLTFSDINGIPIVEKGITQASEISQILQDSLVGFLNFPLPPYLAKSTIFAAYCAHGVIPCMVCASTTPVDGLEANNHYFATSTYREQLSLETGQKIANHAYTWYQNHNLSAQAKIFVTYLKG